MTPLFPRLVRVRQLFPASSPVSIELAIEREFEKLRPDIHPGSRIALGVGSRGIANLALVVRTVIRLVREAGASPFIIPAMGSHGGATPAGQQSLLADYGITEQSMDIPIRASLDVRQVGTTPSGVPVLCSVEALRSDGIILINRIKPHTDFQGSLGSGLIKMSVVGLGKREGAAAMHVAASRRGHEQVIREIASVLRETVPLLGGLALVENQRHETALLEFVRSSQLEFREPALLQLATDLMPRLPFPEIDLLIVDRIGKNISGAGLDPNVTGRWVQGYSSSLVPEPGRSFSPFIRRIFVRDLTPETHGNAIGIGFADITTTRLVRQIDHQATYINALTALTPQAAKIPIHFDTDKECIERALLSLALPDNTVPRVVKIADTLSLAEFEASESLVRDNPLIEPIPSYSDVNDVRH